MSLARPVSDWLLERLAAGELPASTADELRSRLAARGELGRLAAIEASNAQILRDHPARAVLAEVERRAARPPLRAGSTNPSWRVWPALAFGGAAALMVSLLSLKALDAGWHGTDEETAAPRTAQGAERLTAKGLEPYLSIYRRTPSRPERLPANAQVRAGDTLQLAYVAANQRYGVIASVDARHVVTLHLPEQPGAAARLDAGGETALPHAFELDDSPGLEHFVFVTSAAPFDTRVVVERLERKGMAWPAPLSAHSITLEKSAP